MKKILLPFLLFASCLFALDISDIPSIDGAQRQKLQSILDTKQDSLTTAAIPSASVSTNTASIGRTLNSLVLNSIRTNGNFRSFLSATIILDSTLTTAATVALQTLDAGSTNTISIVSDTAGVVQSNAMTCVGWVNPNQVYCFSNFSGSGAVATMITNVVWQF
jgi:hypothetical protein